MSLIPLFPVGKTQQMVTHNTELIADIVPDPLTPSGKKHSKGYSQHRTCCPDPFTVSGENTAMVTHNVELVADIVPDPLNEGALLQAIANGPFQLRWGSFKLQWHWGDVGHLKNTPLLKHHFSSMFYKVLLLLSSTLFYFFCMLLPLC